LSEVMTVVLYAFRTDKSEAIIRWLKQTRERCRDNNILKNPFNSRFKQLTRKDCLLLVFEVNPLYPNFSVFGWLTGLAIWIIWGWTLWIIPCLFIGCLSVFWSADFYFLMTKLGLRKAGYKGPVKRLKLSQFIQEVVL